MKEINNNVNATKGTLFEILFGFHLIPGNEFCKSPLHDNSHIFPHASKDVPVIEVHSNYVKSLRMQHGTRWSSEYEIIAKHARQCAYAFTNHQKKRDRIPKDAAVSQVFWTPDKGDHKNVIGVSDSSNPSDVLVNYNEDIFVGASLKYGGKPKVNFKNPGRDTLSKLTGAVGFHRYRLKHYEKIKLYGFGDNAAENHRMYKKLLQIDSEQITKNIEAVNRSCLESRQKIARSLQNALVGKSDTELKEITHQLLQVQDTKCPYYVVYGKIPHRVQEKYRPRIELSDEIVQRGLNRFSRMYVEKHDGKSMSVIIKGLTEDNISETVIQLGIKRKSGPCMGYNGTVIAPWF